MIDIFTEIWNISGYEVALNGDNTLRPMQNVRRFVDILDFILFHENVCIFIRISLSLFRSGWIDNAIGPHNGLVLIGAIDGLVYWHIYASAGLRN